MVMPIKTAVFPVAGLGTRFLPITKAGPKEMLPLVDKPLIHYVVEEAIQAGITHLVFVTSSSKRTIEDYFDTNFELETRLASAQKYAELERIRKIIPNEVSFSYVRQASPLGLGNAVLCARSVVGEAPFAVLLADDIIDCGNKSCLKEMVNYYEMTGNSILGVEKIPKEQTHHYGIVTLSNKNPPTSQISAIVEKPQPIDAPSNLAVIGRYILTPQIFSLLANTPPGKGGEIQLTDAIALLLEKERVHAFLINGIRYDCGNKLGLLKATIAEALKREDLRDHLLNYLNHITRNECVID